MLQYLPLLADDGNCILKFDIMEETLEKNVGDADQVVVLLSFVERVGLLALRPDGLSTNTQALPVYFLFSVSFNNSPYETYCCYVS